MKSLIVFSILILCVAAQNCNQNSKCSTCTGEDGCGWCGATLQCLPGDEAGPTADNTYCFGAWNFGAGSCKNCTQITDCRECLTWKSDCSWCQGNGNIPPSCQNSNFLGCTRANSCPCEIYKDCSSCTNAYPDCGWCLANSTCVKANDTSKCPAGALSDCPCNFQTNCDSCNKDYQGCIWCDAISQCISNNGSCPIPHEGHNCNKYCQEMGPTCSDCNDLQGCGWCRATQSCVDASSSSCMLTHNCPNCGANAQCSGCMNNEGCVWCTNYETCQPGGFDPTCMVAHSCNAFCGTYDSCDTCNIKKGCAWCDDSNSCVDASSSNCFFAHSCASPSECGFDGGSFVGGMFLVIGIIALSVGGYLFYRWKVGKKISYTELR